MKIPAFWNVTLHHYASRSIVLKDGTAFLFRAQLHDPMTSQKQPT